MKAKHPSNRADKISISLPKDLTAWMRRHVAKRPGYTISALIRDALIPQYNARHAK